MDKIVDSDVPLGGLISVIYRSRNIYLNNSVKLAGLSYGQFFAILLLSKEENITQDRIADTFYLDKGTVARAVKKLEESGYICRTQDPENRRAHKLNLTVEGRQIIPLVFEIVNKWEKTVCEDFSDDELKKLYSMLRTICRRSLQSGTENKEI
jgi:MarR family transcriptional regulator, temperature-dependent positive regulator of motility